MSQSREKHRVKVRSRRMKLHSCEPRLISASHHRSFPSRVILSPTIIMLPSAPRPTTTKYFGCKAVRDMMDAEWKESKIIIILWTYRDMELEDDEIEEEMLCAVAVCMLPHPSTNMELQFETINHLFMIINNLSLAHSRLTLSSNSPRCASTNECKIILHNKTCPKRNQTISPLMCASVGKQLQAIK